MPSSSAQRTAPLVVDGEGFGVTPRAIQRQHELGAQTLAQRMLAHQRDQLGRQRRLLAKGQVGLDSGLDCVEPQLVEPTDLLGCERLVVEAVQWTAAP